MAAIENYGVIGNLRTVALVSNEGSIDFLCFPEFDSPTVFCRLLDEKIGGEFCIRPALDGKRTKQLYLPDTNILMTRFLSDDGVAEVTDFMPVSEHGPNELVRMVKTVRGEIQFEMRCKPAFDYARAETQIESAAEGIVFRARMDPGVALHLRASVPMQIDEGAAIATFSLKAGESATFLLDCFAESDSTTDAGQVPIDIAAVEASFQQTIRYWHDWVAQSKYTGRWREVVNRSALVLKLMTSQKYGSLIAAPTFGLPEDPGGERNWDYRYTWLRDSSFMLYALMRLGFTSEVRPFMRWMRDRLATDAEHGPLQLMYRLNGECDLEEITLDHLSGYENSRPVRIGNGAYSQLQLDIYGELMDAVYLANKYGDGISHAGWDDVCRMVNWVAENWQRPDEGIWEVRGGRREFLHSRVMCWVAMDRALRLAGKRSLPGPLNQWQKTRDEIYRSVHDEFWNEELGAFVQYKGADAVDASALLMPMMRFIGPTDPRWLSTLRVIEDRLVEDTLVYRYDGARHPVDGLSGSDGSFTACSFWYVECLARAHQVDKARLLFEKMLGYANHLGLYSEELGQSGEHLGNFPQALTHLALISAATFLDRALSGTDNTEWR